MTAIPALAGSAIRSEFTVTEEMANIGKVGFDRHMNGWYAAGNPGSYEYTYVAVDFYADASGWYTFGQTAGPIDTEMAVYYNGSFDIDNLVNPDAYNDDSNLSGESCGGFGCPAVQADLEKDIYNTLIISTYYNSMEITLPLSFYSSGAGNIFFRVNASSGTSFFEPVAEPSRTDAMASIMDGIAAGTTSASAELTNMLTGLAVGSEQSRADAIRTIAPDTSATVNTVTTQVMQSGFTRIDGRIAGVRSSKEQSIGASVTSHGSSHASAYANDDTEQDSRFDVFGMFDGASGEEDDAKQDSFANNLWGQFYGFKGYQDEDGGYAGYESFGQSFLFGFDAALTEEIIAGVAFGYTSTDVNMNDFRSGDSVNSDSYQATLYGAYEFAEDWVFGGKLSYARHEIETIRNTAGTTAYGEYGIDQYGVQADIAHTFRFENGLTLEPKAGLSYINMQQESYNETGSALALGYDGANSDQLYSSVSLQVSKSFDLGETTVLTPKATVGWDHNFLTDGTDMVARFVGGGADFTSPGQALEEDSFNLNAGLSVSYNNNLDFHVEANSAFAPNYKEYGAKARLTYSF